MLRHPDGAVGIGNGEPARDAGLGIELGTPAGEQREHRGLARAAVASEQRDAVRRDGEGEVGDGRPGAARVGDREVGRLELR